MNIAAQTFKASLVPGTAVAVVISSDRSFIEKSTGNEYYPGDIARISGVINSAGDIALDAATGIPATNDVDIQGLTYSANLTIGTGNKAKTAPFYFVQDENDGNPGVRIPLTYGNQITWADIRANSLAHRNCNGFRPNYLDSEQQFNTFLQKSQLDATVEYLTGIATSTKHLPFSNALTFTTDKTIYNTKTVNADTVFTVDDTDAVDGASTVLTLIGDGTHTVSFDNNFSPISARKFDKSLGAYNWIFVIKIGNQYLLNIQNIPDTTAPVFVSALVADANKNKIVITFSEVLANIVPANTDFTVSGGKTVTGVVISGLTVTLTASANYAAGESVTFSYTPGVNKLQDGSANPVAAIINQTATNSILPPILNLGSRSFMNRSGDNYVSATGANISNCAAAADENLPAGVVGGVYADVDFTINAFQYILALDPRFSVTTYSDLPLLVLCDGAVYRVTNALTSTGVVCQDGDKFGVFRDGAGVVKAKYFRNGVWTDLYTFSGTYTQKLYCSFNINAISGAGATTYLIKNPTGTGLSFGQTVPLLTSAAVNSSNSAEIVFTFSKPLDTTATGTPNAYDFAITSPGGKTPTALSVSGDTLRISYSPPFAAGNSIGGYYVSGGSNAANRLKDLSGNLVATQGFTVTNNL